MISAEKEDKIIKVLGIFYLLTIPFWSSITENTELILAILIPILIVMSILTIRKYLRDKQNGKPLVRYYIFLFFIFLTFIMAFVSYKEVM